MFSGPQGNVDVTKHPWVLVFVQLEILGNSSPVCAMEDLIVSNSLFAQCRNSRALAPFHVHKRSISKDIDLRFENHSKQGQPSLQFHSVF